MMRWFLRKIGFWVYYCRRNPTATIGFGIILTAVFLGLFAPLVTTYSPTEANPERVLISPGAMHIFGTDSIGMDIYSRVVFAIRTDLFIAVMATFFSVVIGVPLGVFAGYYANRGKLTALLADLMMRFIEIMQAFPVFILAMILVAVLGPSKSNLIVGIAFVNMPIFLRLSRVEIMALRQKTYAEAAKCIGSSNLRIAFRHLLPNGLLPVFTQASITMGFAIILTAGLSFIGAGVRVPEPEWGSMIALGAPNMMTGQWWPSLFPGLALGATVLGFAMVGDNLQKLSDPTRTN
jgi:peptide/nickel transport system permease protein